MRNKYLLIILLSIIAAACGKEPSSKDDSPVLVKVEGTVITEQDLEENLARLLGERQAAVVGANARRNALESMVISRIISGKAKNKISDKQLVAIERKTNAFKENLLVNEYLKNNSVVEPVTEEMVRDYYEKNTDRYGPAIDRRYEMIYTIEKISQNQRDSLLSLLKDADIKTDWKTLTSRIQKKGLEIYYRQGNANDVMLNSRVRNLMKPLKLKTSSGVTFVDGRLYQARIVSETKKEPRPLSEAHMEIRELLKPIKIKDAIRKVSDELVKSAKVEYFNQKKDNKYNN